VLGRFCYAAKHHYSNDESEKLLLVEVSFFLLLVGLQKIDVEVLFIFFEVA
jgi:hypothetical protein